MTQPPLKELVKRYCAPALRWFLVAWFVLTLPVVVLLCANEYCRFILLETATHYRAKLGPMTFVFIGDSITAGGRNWGWRLKGNPFAARNLAGSGYTVRQVQAQARQALTYHPKCVFLLAGTNDIIEDKDLKEVRKDYGDLLEILRGTRVIVTLVPYTGAPSQTARIKEFNASLAKLCDELGIDVVDLNALIAPDGLLSPHYTLDGVHLSEPAYQAWTARLRELLANRP